MHGDVPGHPNEPGPADDEIQKMAAAERTMRGDREGDDDTVKRRTEKALIGSRSGGELGQHAAGAVGPRRRAVHAAMFDHQAVV